MANDLRNWNSAFTKSYSTSGFEYAFNEIEVRLELKDKVLGFFPFKDKDICVYTEAKNKGFKVRQIRFDSSSKEKEAKNTKEKEAKNTKEKEAKNTKEKEAKSTKEKEAKSTKEKEVKTIKEKELKTLFFKEEICSKAKVYDGNSKNLVISTKNEIKIWSFEKKKYLKVKHFENDEIIDFDFNEENQFVIVTKKTITLWNSTKDQIYIKPFEQSDSNAVLFASYVRKKGEVFGTGELYVCRQKTIEVASISFFEAEKHSAISVIGADKHSPTPKNDQLFVEKKVSIPIPGTQDEDYEFVVKKFESKKSSNLPRDTNSNYFTSSEVDEIEQEVKKIKDWRFTTGHLLTQKIDVPTAMFVKATADMETKVVVGTEQGNVYLFQANLNTFIPLPSMGETDTIKHITATKNHYLIAQREMISVINIDNLATEKIVKHPSHMEVSYMKMNRERLVVVYDDKQIKTYLDK